MLLKDPRQNPINKNKVIIGINLLLAPKKTKCIDSYFTKTTTLELVLSRMTSKDGIPFSVFCTSEDLRNAIKSMALNKRLPTSPNTIRDYVLDFAKQIRSYQIDEIATQKKAGCKFSVIFDEWTSTNDRRYLNVIIKSESNLFWDLGLTRIRGSFTSEVGLKMVKDLLNSYDLSFERDIVSVVCDGCSVNTKIKKISNCEMQLCLAHMIQLSITDILYRSTKNSVQIDDVKHENELDTILDFESEQLSEDNKENGGLEVFLEFTENEVIHKSYTQIISKVRKIIAMFKRSPLKNEILQTYILTDFKKEIKLEIDSKTRWSSLLSMLEKFQKLKNCIKKTLIDVNNSLLLDEVELTDIKDLIEALQPLKLGVESLCSRDANLLTADAVLQFCLCELKEKSSKIGLEIYESLKRRILERRTNLSSVLQYLHTGKFESLSEIGVFNILSKNSMAAIIKSLILRLHPEHNDNENKDLDDFSQNIDDPIGIISLDDSQKIQDLKDVLIQAIKNVDNNAHVEQIQVKTSLLETITKEMDLFESGGARGYHLELIYVHLKSISPTSVESERAFSSAGYICNRIRSSLNDKTLGELCFLRAFFKSQNSNEAL